MWSTPTRPEDGGIPNAAAGLSRRCLARLAALVATGAATAACASLHEAAPVGRPEGVTDIAADAYVFGYPLVLMDVTRERSGATNAFYHMRALPTPADREVVRMNLDTLYSSAWLDLRAEPMVVQVPPMPAGRYWLLQVMDAWTNTVHNPSSINPRVHPGQRSLTYAITGPGWSGTLPDTVTPLPVPTTMVWLLGRTQVNGPGDVAAVHALQDQMKLAPLSVWAAGGVNPPASGPVPGGQAPAQEVAAMKAVTFFERLCAVMATNAPAPADEPAMKRFATVGIRPGGSIAGQPVPELDDAVDLAKDHIHRLRNPKAKNENGWFVPTGVGSYGTDYRTRAFIAAVGLGANLPEDAWYPSTFGVADADGKARRYRIRFEADELPPVKAFWSITAYGADNYLIDNPAGVYAVGHWIPVTAGRNGRVEIIVQHEDPGARVPRGNWLPIPAAGTFSLSLRMYAPQPEVLNGTWQPPALTPMV